MSTYVLASSTWYAVSLGILTSTALIFAISRSLFRRLGLVLHYLFLKHIVYAQVAKGIHILRGFTRLDLISIVGILTVNTVAAVIKLQDKVDLLRRTGSLSTINLMLLAFGGRSNIISDYCGFRSRTVSRTHAYLGWTFVREGLLHAILSAAWKFNGAQETSHTAALVVCPSLPSWSWLISGTSKSVSCIGAIIFLSAPRIRRSFYEVFLKVHILLIGIVIATVWIHSWNGRLFVPPVLYLFITAFLWITLDVIRAMFLIYRNVKYRGAITRAASQLIDKDWSAIRVIIKVSRTWHF